MDIGTEELSHLEVVGELIRMHLKPLKSSREAAEADGRNRRWRGSRSV
jgi:Mn-containing catalase